jgi:uncharacterized protein (DUF1778 family)
MTTTTTLSISLEADLAELLSTAAATAGLSREAVVIECVAQQLEIALRHRVLLARLEEMDQHIVALAEFVGESTATPDPAQVASICKYRSERGEVA